MLGDILIVDDEAALRFFAKDRLTRHGWRVHEAKSGEAALAVLEATPCDVILLDLQLGGMDGLEVMTRVRERWPETRIIIVTAYASLTSALEAFRQGAADYLPKPYDIGDLVTAVNKALTRREDYQAAIGNSALADTKSLPQTKFQPSPHRQDLVKRPALFERLRQSIRQHKLTLISAPAGYGKTTLLTEWCSRQDTPTKGRSNKPTDPNSRPTDLSPPCVWLTLDTDDNQPTRFFLSLISSLRTCRPDFGTAAFNFLMANVPADLNRSAHLQNQLAGLLINDITHSLPHPLTLVLEDGHVLTEQTIYKLLDYLIEWLPPQVHVVMTTRQEPALALPRLRAYGRLAELRATDLTFSTAETTSLLNEQYQLNLAPAEINTLQNYTEGWPTGLSLLAIALRGLPHPDDRVDFVHRLTAKDNPSAPQAYIFDYLADEVMKQEPRQIQTFLLETSIVNDLSPALCQAVTKRTDTAELLIRLRQHNLFLTPARPHRLSGANATWGIANQPSFSETQRYTRFFTHFLRHNLTRDMPDRIVELHHRAAEAASSPEQRLDHYLAAGLWQPAIEVIKGQSEAWLSAGRVKTLSSRLKALPLALRQQDPDLLHVLGGCAWRKNELGQAHTQLSEALAGFKQIDNVRGQGQALTDLATTTLLQADLKGAQDFLDQALAHPLTTREQVRLALHRVWLDACQNDWSQMKHNLELALSIAHKSGATTTLRTLATHFNPAMVLLPETLPQLLALALPQKPASARRDRLWQVAVDWQRTTVYWQHGEFDQVLLRGRQTLQRQELLAPTYLPAAIDILRLMTLVHLVREAFDQAHHCLDRLFDQLPHYPLLKMHEVGFLYLRGRAYWLQQRWPECRQISDQLAQRPGLLQPTLIATLRGLLCQADQDYDSAEQYLQEATRLADQQPLVGLFSRPGLLLAQLYLTWDRPQEALARFVPLLTECRDMSCPGPLFQEGRTITELLQLAIRQGQCPTFARQSQARLGIVPVRQATSVPETGETLTSRELEVLELMAAGSSNRSIAQQLNISYFTVKSHITHILRKLSVSAREQAVTCARDLGLLSETVGRS